MAITHTFGVNWSQSGGTSLLGSVAVASDAENNLSFTVAASVTNQLEPLAVTIAKIKGLYIKSDADVTLKTNSSGSPQETITVKAGVPICWYSNNGFAIGGIFAGDLTATYWSNAGVTVANVEVRVLKSA
jgi:hypothetical protein